MPQLPMARRPLTALQLSTLDFMRSSHAANAQWPSPKQIAEHFRVSSKTARDRLQVLIVKGVVSQAEPEAPYVALDTAFVMEGGAS